MGAAKPATNPVPPPSYAVATGVAGRVVFTGMTPELIQAAHVFAKQHGIRLLNLHLTAPDLGSD